MHRTVFSRPAHAILPALLSALLLLVATPAPTAAYTNDFPFRGTVGRLDPWGFYTGYCTSFVAWRLSQHGIVFHGASLKGPNGQTAFFGNGGSWDRAAQQIGFLVDTHPSPGSVAVWHGGEDHAWSGGHVAWVVSVDTAGRATVEEYNWSVRFGYDVRVGQAGRYIHFLPVASQPTGAVKPSPVSYRTYHTTQRLLKRRGPGRGYRSVGAVGRGAAVQIVCQARSTSTVLGSHIWDRLLDGSYVSDYYVTTPVFNGFSPGLTRC